jgi:S-DNA-T family DNA segregation ATPase FtsK/SpoIIIE
MRKKLEFQADRIETVLTLHKIPARVTGGTVTPRWVRFQVLPAIGAKISRIRGLSEELAAALDVSSCRVSRRGAAVDVEVPRDDQQPVRLLPLYHQLTSQLPNQQANHPPIPLITAILGLGDDGAPLLIRLSSPDVAHVLVAGTTGSGKTVLLQTMILSLALTNRPPSAPPSGREPTPSPCEGEGRGGGLALVLIDPKGRAFSPFNGLPHLARPVVREAEEAVEALHSLVRLMERRGDPSGFPKSKGPVVVVIDELADLLMVGGEPVQWALTRLTQRGREAGIHVIAATQKPTTAVLGSLVKANFPVRLVGRVTSAEDARTATGWSGTGAERLMGRGDFLAVAEGRVIRFQAAHASPEEIREAVAHLAPGEPASVTPSLASASLQASLQRARVLLCPGRWPG